MQTTRSLIEVVKPGLATSVQHGPAYYHVGIPPSPLDQYASRAANLLVGNPRKPPCSNARCSAPS